MGVVGVATLTEVKDRRELLFAAMPLLFAVHQFIEGFVWLGLNGTLTGLVAHNAGAAFVLYTHGLLPFLFPLEVTARHHSIVYFNSVTTSTAVAVLYVIATCGALFFSGFRYLIALGILNMVGVIVVRLIMRYGFTSIWCAYAAVISVLIYFHFRRNRGLLAGIYARAT